MFKVKEDLNQKCSGTPALSGTVVGTKPCVLTSLAGRRKTNAFST
jgi:hypothetical protein